VLAKLRMHTDLTEFHGFGHYCSWPTTSLICQDVCSAYSTKDLPKEKAARKQKKECAQEKNKNAPNADGSSLEVTQSMSKPNKYGKF
jgi:hypothetical protein